jgi:hypothetical protein
MNKSEASATQSASDSAAKYCPSDQEIATRAYAIFVARGATLGSELDDWLQAERELVENNKDSALLHSVAAA